MEKPSTVIVIFGATGDLAKRKLYPSIYNLYKKGQLSKKFAVVGVARRAWTNEIIRENVSASIKSEVEGDISDLDEFSNHFYYLPFDVTSKSSYHDLDNLINSLEDEYDIQGNRIFYMAMAPEFFGTIALNLKTEGVTNTKGWTRLVIEKPFGHNYDSAKKLNDEIREAFTEDEIYRIDHYLGKEMVQNIEVIRFANAIFEPLWNNRYISNVQITSSETLGVEDRGGYYENSGALRDMVQNHMLQMVSLLAMDPPIRLTTDEIRSEKIKVLRALRTIKGDKVEKYFVRGQYGPGKINNNEVPGYRSEDKVNPDSNTETFVAGKLMIDNHRWAGVPFYIRTGKRMKEKSTKIVIQFKELPMNLYYKNKETLHSNLLIIHIQPDEGISLTLNGKKLGPTGGTVPVRLDYRNDGIDGFNTPEAYERLLYDCMLGDATNFAHWDELDLSWNFIDAISEVWEKKSKKEPFLYPSGTMGPNESEDLLQENGHKWWPITKYELE
ncbi:glucose-6-phosphate dehydrogenase [Evansella cellulosilytica]|uniref:Glucose-6-phosphate 1-dehydrogenase n=1 Tax=Evansella cellulosilytica (strain ATCC 21833 / DSM 2522 / FERM P-1141 / JCM 9156 / N-4) TaxID=649639 RepID=E6U0D8_EVAC2|nr:glucose-6-phosphate dehydrogenase [Evansella cellulosilytica]ADU30254.1 glucose-6-phosphate 1-dehydrogenase [Evansella cellulosilytica DSM 2522]